MDIYDADTVEALSRSRNPADYLSRGVVEMSGHMVERAGLAFKGRRIMAE